MDFLISLTKNVGIAGAAITILVTVPGLGTVLFSFLVAAAAGSSFKVISDGIKWVKDIMAKMEAAKAKKEKEEKEKENKVEEKAQETTQTTLNPDQLKPQPQQETVVQG
jgi:flagellar biosynthesis component FlhA